MFIQHYLLHKLRVRSRLAQSDLAHIMSLSDYASVSRWENGAKRPSMEVLVSYHLLFDIPMETLLERMRHGLLERMKNKIEIRIEELKHMPMTKTKKFTRRISFLEEALARIVSKGN